jgi:antitoxin HigA-1
LLLVEFLNPLRMTQFEFWAHLGIPIQRVNEIIKGKRGVTAETAWLFSQALGTSPEFWMNLQAAHDLAKSRPRPRNGKISRIRKVRGPAGQGERLVAHLKGRGTVNMGTDEILALTRR